MKRILIVSPVHVWDDVRVFKKEAVSLSESGYRVTIIARIDKNNVINKIVIKRPWGSYKNRLLRFFSLPLIIAQALFYKADIYHLHNPDTLPIAFFLRVIRRRVIYDTHEDFSQRILAREWLAPIVRAPLAKLVSRLEWAVARCSNAAIGTQPNVVRRLGSNSHLIGNPPRIDDDLLNNISQHAMSIPELHEEFRLIYIGTISISRGLTEMVNSLELVNKKISARLWLIGPASREDLIQAKKLPGWGFVDYMPRMEQEKAFAYVSRSDVGLIVIRDVGDHAQTDPNKIYEYMALGKPFIASNFPAWIDRLEGYEAGWFVQHSNHRALSNKIIEIASMSDVVLKEKGKNAALFTKTYNWKCEEKKLIKIYEEVLDG